MTLSLSLIPNKDKKKRPFVLFFSSSAVFVLSMDSFRDHVVGTTDSELALQHDHVEVKSASDILKRVPVRQYCQNTSVEGVRAEESVLAAIQLFQDKGIQSVPVLGHGSKGHFAFVDVLDLLHFALQVCGLICTLCLSLCSLFPLISQMLSSTSSTSDLLCLEKRGHHSRASTREIQHHAMQRSCESLRPRPFLWARL